MGAMEAVAVRQRGVYAVRMFDETVDLRCEACGRRLKRPLHKLRRNPRVQCPNCYRDIVVPLELLVNERERWDVDDEKDAAE